MCSGGRQSICCNWSSHWIAFCFCWHLWPISFQTLLNPRGLYLASLGPIYVILLVSGALAFHAAGGRVRTLCACLCGRRGKGTAPSTAESWFAKDKVTASLVPRTMVFSGTCLVPLSLFLSCCVCVCSCTAYDEDRLGSDPKKTVVLPYCCVNELVTSNVTFYIPKYWKTSFIDPWVCGSYPRLGIEPTALTSAG